MAHLGDTFLVDRGHERSALDRGRVDRKRSGPQSGYNEAYKNESGEVAPSLALALMAVTSGRIEMGERGGGFGHDCRGLNSWRLR